MSDLLEGKPIEATEFKNVNETAARDFVQNFDPRKDEIDMKIFK